VAEEKTKATKRSTVSSASDRQVVRLVTAFKTLKDKALKVALVDVAEQMAERPGFFQAAQKRH
jgi:hypothetical protein